MTEIEEAIAKLPAPEFRHLLRKLKERDADEWDRQIEEDANNGKLANFYSNLMSEQTSGPKIPLDEVLDDPRFS